jgi:hypothetical protein
MLNNKGKKERKEEKKKERRKKERDHTGHKARVKHHT